MVFGRAWKDCTKICYESSNDQTGLFILLFEHWMFAMKQGVHRSRLQASPG